MKLRLGLGFALGCMAGCTFSSNNTQVQSAVHDIPETNSLLKASACPNGETLEQWSQVAGQSAIDEAEVSKLFESEQAEFGNWLKILPASHQRTVRFDACRAADGRLSVKRVVVRMMQETRLSIQDYVYTISENGEETVSDRSYESLTISGQELNMVALLDGFVSQLDLPKKDSALDLFRFSLRTLKNGDTVAYVTKDNMVVQDVSVGHLEKINVLEKDELCGAGLQYFTEEFSKPGWKLLLQSCKAHSGSVFGGFTQHTKRISAELTDVARGIHQKLEQSELEGKLEDFQEHHNFCDNFTVTFSGYKTRVWPGRFAAGGCLEEEEKPAGEVGHSQVPMHLIFQDANVEKSWVLKSTD